MGPQPNVLTEVATACRNQRLVLEEARKPLTIIERAKKKAIKLVLADRNCSFCGKTGHSVETCPALPAAFPRDFSSREKQFVTNLMESERVDVEKNFRGMNLEQAQKSIEQTGRQFNADNPWMHTTDARGALRRQAGYWKAIGADRTILSWIMCGVELRFAEEPLPLKFPNNLSCKKPEHEAFVRREVKDMVEAGAWREATTGEVRVGNPITVEPKAGGKYRMCVDARWTNAHTPKPYFKLETPTQALPEVVKKGDKMITTDLAKAYYSVPIADEIGPYLAVEFDGKWYIPRVLPFGHSLAPFVFNKIVRQTVAVSRVLGVRVYNYTYG